MKNALTLITALLICFTAYADTYVGLDYALSKPKNYIQCPCPPDGQLQPIQAAVEIPLMVFRLGHNFDNGVFVEGRHGRGLKKSDSVVSFEDGFSFRGVDIELDHFSYVGVGYSFLRDEQFSPYVSVGKMTNMVLTAYDPQTGAKDRRESYSGTAFGAGVNWNFHDDWRVSLNYQSYARGDWGDDGTVKFSTLSLGMSYSF